MKQFSLEEFKKNPNRKVVTRDGRKVRIICTDAVNSHPIVGLIEQRNGLNSTCNFNADGTVNKNRKHGKDLLFAPMKREGWVNLFSHPYGLNTGHIYETKEEAMLRIGDRPKDHYVGTVKITWEE